MLGVVLEQRVRLAPSTDIQSRKFGFICALIAANDSGRQFYDECNLVLLADLEQTNRDQDGR